MGRLALPAGLLHAHGKTFLFKYFAVNFHFGVRPFQNRALSVIVNFPGDCLCLGIGIIKVLYKAINNMFEGINFIVP